MHSISAKLTPTELEARITRNLIVAHQIAYALVSPDLEVLQVSENFRQVLRNSLQESVEGRPLPDLLWEFVGAEEVLGRVLRGELPCFRLDWINRTALDGSTCYVDFWVVPLADDDPERGLLLIIEDVSQAGQLEQRLAQDRNQLRLTQARLVQANEELERLSRLKTLFLSVAVHDLRAPLSAIGLSLELALKYLGSNRVTEAPHYLSTARDQVSQLDNLIGNLLDLDLLEQGRLSVYPVPCDLNSILNESVEMMGEHIQHRGLKLRVAIPLAPIWVRVDPVRARQILTNLLSNAVKYSSAVGTVQVSTWSDSQVGVIEVKDSGPGIPEAELAHIFELYYRTEGAARKSVPGSGLGLFIVKSLVDAHGGKVEVTSEPGKGTAFNIRLSLAQPG